MNWLYATVRGFFAALFDWGQAQAEKPKTIENVNTPQTVRDRMSAARDAYLQRLRDEKRLRDRQPD